MRLPTIKNIALFIIAIIYLYGCKSSNDTNSEFTYFGGEIINPKTNYVVLSKGYDNIDTLYLDKKNRFLHKIKNVDEGLYFFRHNPENQVILLEKGDSILMRLNTIEFDESLVFTGKGSIKNNFLIDMFVQNEVERNRLKRMGFNLSPNYFKKNQDSLLKSKQEAYDRLINKYELSTLAKKIAHASITFEYNSRHELYYNRRFRNGINTNPNELPENFFDYRKNINFNDNYLKRSYSYNRYLNYYFSNVILSKGTDASTKNSNLNNTIYKLNLIDSMVINSYIKNKLIKRVTTNFILNTKNEIDSKKVLNHYLNLNTNKHSQKEVQRLEESISKIRTNNELPYQELITTTGNHIALTSVLKKPTTALYFWSMDSKNHYVRAHKKAHYLKIKYPNVDFIGINTDDDDESNNWLKTIKRHHYNLEDEYRFKSPKCSSQELVIHHRNKVILVDQEGRIVNPNTNFFHSDFESQLAKPMTLITSLK